MNYTKSITPAFDIDGRRKRLVGQLAELYDGEILLHSQVYSTPGQAEQALDAIVYDLLSDLHQHGLVDNVPVALEAEGVTSAHLPSWERAADLPDCPICNDTWTCAVCDAKLTAQLTTALATLDRDLAAMEPLLIDDPLSDQRLYITDPAKRLVPTA